MAKITFQTELPDSMLHEFVQHLRDFEQRDPHRIHMQEWVDAPEMSLNEAIRALEVSPGFSLRKTWPLS